MAVEKRCFLILVVWMITVIMLGADVTKVAGWPVNVQGLGVSDASIEWDEKGSPVRFVAKILSPSGSESAGLQFHIEIEGHPNPQEGSILRRCGVFLVTDTDIKRLPDTLNGSITPEVDLGACSVRRVVYTFFKAADGPIADQLRLVRAHEKQRLAKIQRDLQATCGSLRTRISNKRISDLTVAESEQMDACKAVGLW